MLVVTEEPSKKGMRSPIELFWTAKKATTAIKTMTKTILGFVTFETLSTILTIKNLIHDNPW